MFCGVLFRQLFMHSAGQPLKLFCVMTLISFAQDNVPMKDNLAPELMPMAEYNRLFEVNLRGTSSACLRAF
jgi:hypothetical protein